MASGVQVNNLKKVFKNGQGIYNVNLEFSTGGIHALLGQNGAGKSTTILCLMGVLKPDSGTISLSGKKISPGDNSVRKRMGYAPELPALPAYLTGRECLVTYGLIRGIGKKDLNDEVAYLIEKVGIQQFADLRTSGYSRGTLAKLDLAISLLGSPELLILDEPTAGLDPLSKREFMTLLKTMVSSDQMVMISSHQLSDVEKYCSTATIIHRGRTLFQSSISDMRGMMKEQSGSEMELEDAFIRIVKESENPG